LPAGPDALLRDRGLDSLACAELATALEDRYGVRVVDADVEGLRSIRDVAAAVSLSLEPRPRIPIGVGRVQAPFRFLTGWAFAWEARLHVDGREHVPPSGPVILAANHRSFLDVPLLVIASPRTVVFMAKRELFKNGFVALWLREMGGFPVRREIADLRAIDTGLAVLEEGRVLGLYPEGTRNHGDGLLPFLNGAAWLALHTGATIVPCGIRGTEKIPPGRRKSLRRDVRLQFGAPMSVERQSDPAVRRANAPALTERLREAIGTLIS
jgi:1-acyl-sn-glycerol-3-phosphate acyltransferase